MLPGTKPRVQRNLSNVVLREDRPFEYHGLPCVEPISAWMDRPDRISRQIRLQLK
jgi:hypothetical protein